MNLVDELLKADTKVAEELETGVFKSKKLAKLIGSDEPIDVTIREISTRRVSDISGYQYDKKGNVDVSKIFDAKLMIVVEGCVEPDLRNKELQAHFTCANARELAEKLFGSEVYELSDAISVLSGASNEDEKEEEIKN